MTDIIDYNSDLEYLLKIQAEECESFSILHRYSYEKYSERSNYINIPVIILSSAIGFATGIDIGYDKVPEKDYDFWCVAFKDANDKEIYRKDATPDEIARMRNDPDNYCKVWREFHYQGKPHRWIVWPHSISKGWCEPISGTL